MSVPATGIFKNYNTIEDFKAADKAALCNDVASKVRSCIYASAGKIAMLIPTRSGTASS
jgi:hypothetical protein